MQKTILLMLSLFCSAQLFSQGFKRIEQLTGQGTERINDIIVDNSGNVITVGSFTNAVDFDPGTGEYKLISNGYNDVFIRKVNAHGGLIWAKSIGDAGDDNGIGVVVDAAGDVYVSGSFVSEADLDPGQGIQKRLADQPGNYNYFILKLNANGDFQWATTESSTVFNDKYTNAIAPVKLDKSGNVYMAYGFGSTSFMAINKYACNSGQRAWSKRFVTTGGSNSMIAGATLSVDTAENICIAGTFAGDVNFDFNGGNNILSATTENAFITKYTSSGNMLWLRRIGTTHHTSISAMTTDDGGNVLVCGSFSGTVDFDPGTAYHTATSGNNNMNMYLLKLDAGGNFDWVNAYISAGGGNYPYDLATDLSGNVYMTGVFESTATDFNPGGQTKIVPVAKGGDIFAVKIAPAGELVWLEQAGGVNWDAGTALAISPMYETYIAGTFIGIANFTPLHNYTVSLTAQGADDAFVLKLGKCPIQDTSIQVNGKILTSNATAASYQWIDCATRLPVTHGTGTMSKDFTPWIPGNYAVVLTNGEGCIDTSACFPVTVSIDELSQPVFSVYPNPTTGKVYVSLGKKYSAISYDVINVFGQVVASGIYANASEVNTEINAPAGVYILRIRADNEREFNTYIIKD